MICLFAIPRRWFDRRVQRAAQEKLSRLESVGFNMSRNDKKVVLFGQLLTTIRSIADIEEIHRGGQNEPLGGHD